MQIEAAAIRQLGQLTRAVQSLAGQDLVVGVGWAAVRPDNSAADWAQVIVATATWGVARGAPARQ